MNLEDLYRLLRTDHVQAQGVFDTVGDPLLVLDASLRVKAASRAFFEVFKVDRDETIGQPLHALGNGQWDLPDLRRLLEDVIPQASAIVDYKIDHEVPGLGRRSMLLTARTLHHPDNARHSMLLTIVDATERQRREVEREMLFRELRHRMKNLFSVAQAIARQTTTEGRTAEEYRDDFLGRFAALTQAEDLAAGEKKGVRGLRVLLTHILEPYMADPQPVVIEPEIDVELPIHMLQPLSLILHELATNAAKYGALSVKGGQVRITWQIEEDAGNLRLKWVETGGPAVTVPKTTGYGTQLIEAVASCTLGGRVTQDFAADGLRVEVAVPLRGPRPAPSRPDQPHPVSGIPPDRSDSAAE